MQPERRLGMRKPLDQLTFIGLPGDNGGIVLNVSEGGLGFFAVAPVEKGVPIQFRFSPKVLGGVEGIGEVVWHDETGKSCGLRFTHVPEEVRELIRDWSDQPKVDVPVVSDPVSETASEMEPPTHFDMAASASIGTNQISSGNRERSSFVTEPLNPLSLFPAEPGSEGVTTAVSTSQPRSLYSRHSVVALVLTIVSASIVAIGLFSYMYMRAPGESLIHWEEKIWSRLHPKSTAPSSVPSTTFPTQTTR